MALRAGEQARHLWTGGFGRLYDDRVSAPDFGFIRLYPYEQSRSGHHFQCAGLYEAQSGGDGRIPFSAQLFAHADRCGIGDRNGSYTYYLRNADGSPMLDPDGKMMTEVRDFKPYFLLDGRLSWEKEGVEALFRRDEHDRYPLFRFRRVGDARRLVFGRYRRDDRVMSGKVCLWRAGIESRPVLSLRKVSYCEIRPWNT